jgi:hypothetical protein
MRNEKKSTDKAKIVIPSQMKVLPEEHELRTARILSEHFNTTVEFLVEHDGFMIKTPDIKMNGVEWEMKSPAGKSVTTINKQVERALQQSNRIIIDGYRCKIEDTIIERRLKYECEHRRAIKQLLFITKDKKVLAIK